MSDIDFTVVFKKPFTLADSDKVSRAYFKLKKYLPMLGEIEIFSALEWTQLEQLWKENGELLQLLKDLKKIRWMEWSLEKYIGNSYQTFKIKRAIYYILKKYELSLPEIENLKTKDNHFYLGIGLSNYVINLLPLTESLGKTKLPAVFSAYSKDLDTTVGHSTNAPPILNIDSLAAAGILALFPPHHDDKPLDVVKSLRNNPVFKPYFISSLKNELLYANASPRVHIRYRNSSWQWTERLIKELIFYEGPGNSNSLLDTINNHLHELK